MRNKQGNIQFDLFCLWYNAADFKPDNYCIHFCNAKELCFHCGGFRAKGKHEQPETYKDLFKEKKGQWFNMVDWGKKCCFFCIYPYGGCKKECRTNYGKKQWYAGS